MKKRLICAALACLMLWGCAFEAAEPEQKAYDATFLTVFDTITTIKGFADSKEAFAETARQIEEELTVYHQLFDIYQDYEGVSNLKTVNDQAGIAPVKVDRAIIDLLLECKRYYELTGGMVNVAMGSVLRLWHEARTDGLNDIANAYLPDPEALEEAAKHTDINCLIIDQENSTVYLSDPAMRLDVGAIAKGWSVQRVMEKAPSGMLVSVGGNVYATGPKDQAGTPWRVGIQNPDGGENYLHIMDVTSGSLVTSGDYQRCYMVDGKIYHHIIHPDTLYPAESWRSVTIICRDSGLADALSTALFLLPLEEGLALLEKTGAEAMWVDSQGQNHYSPGFEALIRT